MMVSKKEKIKVKGSIGEFLSTLIVGKPGSGKTLAMLEFMSQVRNNSEKAIAYDVKGTFVSKFYREGKDIILNPLDTRFPNWDLWSECDSPQDFNNIATALMPLPKSTGDTFWIKASRTIFAAACRELKNKGCRDTRELLQLIFSNTEDEDKLAELLKGTEAEVLVSKDIKQTALSIKTTLTTFCKCLMYLPPFDESKPSFSIREWMKTNNDAWLFISVVDIEKSESLKPLMSMWVDIAFQSVLSRDKTDDSMVYSFVDELPSLNRLKSIETLLAEGREYGSAFFAAVQDISQFKVIYGEQAKTLLALFNTGLFFNPPEFTGYSMDGELSEKEHCEMVSLDHLEGYLKVSTEDAAKIKFKTHSYANIAPEIILRKIKLDDFNLNTDKEGNHQTVKEISVSKINILNGDEDDEKDDDECAGNNNEGEDDDDE